MFCSVFVVVGVVLKPKTQYFHLLSLSLYWTIKTSDMDFTSIHKQAVIGLVAGLVEADSWIEDEEIEFSQDVMDALECTDEDFEIGQDMPLLQALVIVKNMTDEQKSAVSDVLSATIVADRIITAEEAEIFDYVSELTGIDEILNMEDKQKAETLKELASEAD